MKECLTRLWVKVQSGTPGGWARACMGVWRLICAKVPDGETKERPVCAMTWHGFLGDSGERSLVVQVCTLSTLR